MVSLCLYALKNASLEEEEVSVSLPRIRAKTRGPNKKLKRKGENRGRRKKGRLGGGRKR